MYTRYQWTSLTNYGFDGLMVAVLARKNPALVPVGAFLIAYIRIGADIKIKCLGCGRIVMLERAVFVKRRKKVLSQGPVPEAETLRLMQNQQ